MAVCTQRPVRTRGTKSTEGVEINSVFTHRSETKVSLWVYCPWPAMRSTLPLPLLASARFSHSTANSFEAYWSKIDIPIHHWIKDRHWAAQSNSPSLSIPSHAEDLLLLKHEAGIHRTPDRCLQRTMPDDVEGLKHDVVARYTSALGFPMNTEIKAAVSPLPSGLEDWWLR